jgi:hypothetical protein
VREVVVVEEAGSKPMSESLQVREYVEEVRTPRRGHVAATELGDFRSSIFLNPKAREV